MNHHNGLRQPYTRPVLPVEDVLRRAQATHDGLCTRRSVRDFSDAPVPREVIERLILTAGTAPSGAHMQPWHFAAVSDPHIKAQIRAAAEEEERRNYGQRMSEEWREALRPLGTDADKPHLTEAPWLVVLFAVAWGRHADGTKKRHYYVQESVGIAAGFFISAVHAAGLATLPHTPSPMRFLGDILGRPTNERATLLLPVGWPADDCTVPSLERKPLSAISSWFEADPTPDPG